MTLRDPPRHFVRHPVAPAVVRVHSHDVRRADGERVPAHAPAGRRQEVAAGASRGGEVTERKFGALALGASNVGGSRTPAAHAQQQRRRVDWNLQ